MLLMSERSLLLANSERRVLCSQLWCFGWLAPLFDICWIVEVIEGSRTLNGKRIMLFSGSIQLD